MIRVFFIFLAFSIGITTGYYFPIKMVVNTNLLLSPKSYDFISKINEKNNYRQIAVVGTIESINYDSGTMVLLYYPGYTDSEKKLIKINFDKTTNINDTEISKKDGIIEYWKNFPKKTNSILLSEGNVINLFIKYDDKLKMLTTKNINLVLKNILDI